MNDIILTKWERQLMLALKKHEEVVLGDIPHFTQEQINIYSKSLESKGLVCTDECEEEGVFRVYLTDEGDYYLSINPLAKNPFLTPNRKWLITTFISISALILSLIALIK